LFSGRFVGHLWHYGTFRMTCVYLPEGTYELQASLRRTASLGDDWTGFMVIEDPNLASGFALIAMLNLPAVAVDYGTGSAIYKCQTSGWYRVGLIWTAVSEDYAPCLGWIGARRLVGTHNG
jgi:hypothetical protein